jgi:hypothetical protein
MASSCVPTTRSLYAWEIQEARRVFADQLKYDPLRIHECAAWPDSLNRFGLWLKRMPSTTVPNAVTVGNHLYFPVNLPSSPVPADHPDMIKVAWLIHELTHAWQYQHMGWRYLALALQAQLKAKAQAYDFGGEDGLLKRTQQGWTLADFNLEQQGDIARSYYLRLVKGQGVTAWQPFIADFQGRDAQPGFA